MGRKTLIILVAVSLACAWGVLGFAGELGYSLDGAGKGFKTPLEPNSTVLALDALVAKPMGLCTTVVGTGVFAITIPFTAPSGDLGRAGRAMVVNPAGWTFMRPLGKSDFRFEDPPLLPMGSR